MELLESVEYVRRGRMTKLSNLPNCCFSYFFLLELKYTRYIFSSLRLIRAYILNVQVYLSLLLIRIEIYSS